MVLTINSYFIYFFNGVVNINKNIILGVIAILIVSGVGIAYYFNPGSSISQDGNITITDMVGRTVTVLVRFSNVVATSPPMTTMVYMLTP